MAKRELDALSVGQLRVTLFTTQPFAQPSQSWWSRLFNFPPEATAAKPQARVFEEAGAFHGGGRLIIKADGPRADLNVVPGGKPQPGFTSIGRPLSAALPPFIDVAKRFLKDCDHPTVIRLAVGLVLGHDEESNEKAVAEVLGYLPELHLSDAATARDVSFHINRRRDSQAVAGLRINRLGKWSALETQLIVVGPAGAQNLGGGAVSQIELDINTDVTRTTPFSDEELPRVLAELADMAKEIAEKGDVA